MKDEINQHQLKRLIKQLIDAQEAERRSIAGRLHNEASQSLTAIQLRLLTIHDELPENDPTRQKINEATQIISETMTRLRVLAYDLRPPELDTLGLNATLETLCREVAQQANFSVTYRGIDHLPPLPDTVAIDFYRCLQEALTNVANHAHATLVQVDLNFDDEYICLQIIDNGKGLDSDTETMLGGSGLGLLRIKERFENNKGFLIAKSDKGVGFILEVGVPWKKGNIQV